MSEGYCGKSCESCEWREKLNCPGCQDGPGRRWSGDCEIAECCHSKGHERCASCGFMQSGCGKNRRQEHVPAMRQRALEEKERHQCWLAENAPRLGKWLWLLFWLAIPTVISNLMTNETVVERLPGLQLPGEILSFVCLLTYGFILWQLRDLADGYRVAALCNAASAIVNLAATLLVGNGSDPGKAGLALVLLIPVMIASLYGTYREYYAHAEILCGVDDELAEKWKTLWKWEIGLLLGFLGCIIIMAIAAILGLLAILAAAIGIIVVGILRLVYLYRMANLFREYTAEGCL